MVMALSLAALAIIYKHAGKPTLTGGHAVADLLRAVKWHTQTEPTHYYSLLRVMAHYITLSFFVLFLIRRARATGIMVFYGAEIWVAPGKNTRAHLRT
jgi:hypothetical protein